jgi:hopanoid biosynthesis associated RND transporter like protein HpnN
MLTGTARISSGLAWWVRRVLRFPKTTVVIVLLLAVASLGYTRGRLGINTDTANMIAAELQWRQDFDAYRESFAVRDRNLVILVDAAAPDLAEAFAADLAATLRLEPALFRSVFLAGEGEFFERNGLLYLSAEQLEDLGDRLAAAQPLIGLLTRQLNGAGVVAVARTALEESGSAADTGPLDALYVELAGSFQSAAAGERRPLPWRELMTGMPDAPERHLVLVQPALDFDLIQPAREAIDRVRSIAADLQARQDIDVSVRLTGTIAMEHEELVSVTRGARFAGIAALGLVTLVLLWALRSFVLLAFSLVTLLAGLCYTAAFAAFAVGHLNLLSVAFAVLYVGLGVDFILHICLRLKELRAGPGTGDVGAALTETIAGVGTSLVICAATTAAFYSFVPTQFEGVSELGVISGTGMLISLVISVTLLPALLALAPAASRGRPLQDGLRRAAAIAWLRGPKRVVPAAVVIGLLSLIALPRVTFDSNPIHLRDRESESVRAIEDLAAVSEAPLLNLIALAPDHAVAQRWARELERLPEVRQVITVDSLVPPDQADKQRLLEDIGLVMGPRFAEVTPAEFDAAALRRALEQLAAALRSVERPSEPQRALLEASDDLVAYLDAAPGDDVRSLAALDADLTAGLARQLRRLGAGLEARPFGRADLPQELARRWVNPAGQEVVEIVPAENVNDNAAAERFVTAVRSVVPNATGLPVVHQEASATVVRSFQLAFLYALALVSLLLLFFLRGGGDMLLVLVPILFAATVTAAATVWLGIPFNFANIIALPLLVGVGVDNGIHLVHRMRTEPPKDGEPLNTSTSRAVLASGLTTIASFGNLAFSAHVGMASMGQLLTVGMAVTLAATLILLPALLRRGPRA